MHRWWLVSLLLASAPGWAEDGLSLVAQDGQPVVLRPADGQLLVLHFWATWCPTCVTELGDLQRAAEHCPTDRLRVIAVNVGEEPAAIAAFVSEHGVTLPVLRDPAGDAWREIDGRGLPTNLFWSAEEKRSEVGPKSASEWSALVAPHGCETNPAGTKPEEPAPQAR